MHKRRVMFWLLIGVLVCGLVYPVFANNLPHKFGLRLTRHPTLPQYQPKRHLESLPSAYTIQNVPPVGDQDGVGSCAYWAAIYMGKTIEEAYASGWSAKDHIFNPMFGYNVLSKGVQDAGGCFDTILRWLMEYGAAPYSVCNIDNEDYHTMPSFEAFKEALKYRIKGGYWIFLRSTRENGFGNPPYSPLDDDTIRQIKELIAQNHPVLIAVPVYQSWADHYSWSDVHHIDIYNGPEPGEELLGWHGMCVYGYDDNKQAFLVRNSWGLDWNKGGDIWFSYDFFRRYIAEAWTMEERPNTMPNVYMVIEIQHGCLNDIWLTVYKGDHPDTWLVDYIDEDVVEHCTYAPYIWPYLDYWCIDDWTDTRQYIKFAVSLDHLAKYDGEWKIVVKDCEIRETGQIKTLYIVDNGRRIDFQTPIAIPDDSAIEITLDSTTINQPPQIDAVDIYPYSGYRPLDVHITIHAYDPDNDVLTCTLDMYSADTGEFIRTIEGSPGQLDFDITIDDTGCFFFVVHVSDGLHTISTETLNVCVDENPNPEPNPEPEPVIALGGGCTVNEHGSFLDDLILGFGFMGLLFFWEGGKSEKRKK